MCRSCNKSFNDLTKSALSCTKLPLQTWIEYVKGMIIGLSIRKNAENVGVGVKTSFYMRHKVLDCIRAFMGVGDVDGIVEMDESFKGNHKKSGFKMPRPARKRGKQVKKRGISNEQVCVATAIDNFNDGDYFLMDKSIKDSTDSELSKLRNKTFGFIFQYFALLKDYTAIENVKVPLNYRKIPKKEKSEKCIKYLEYVDLKNHMNKLPNEMSGGQQQRVAIARALAQETDIILADEPTGALDQNTSKEIMQILKSINKLGKTNIIITHDNNIASHCNRIINIEDGKIIYDSNLTNNIC